MPFKNLFDNHLKVAEVIWIADQTPARKCYPDFFLIGKNQQVFKVSCGVVPNQTFCNTCPTVSVYVVVGTRKREQEEVDKGKRKSGFDDKSGTTGIPLW